MTTTIQQPAAGERRYETLTATPLSPHIGGEVSGIDLSAPLDDRQKRDLLQVFADYQVIFFRDQLLDFEAHKRFAGVFGGLHRHVGPSTESRPVEGEPEIRILHFDENSEKVAGEIWHTDQSCAVIPPLGSALYLKTVPPNGGGDTMWASMYAAYDDLSDKMKTYLDGMTATHDGSRAFGKDAPVNVHPVVPVHPVTGRKLLYINRGQTSHLNGVSREESDAVLTYLYNHCANPEWIVRFHWRQNSMALWDNRCTHHRAIWDYYPNVRSGFRIQIKGNAPPTA
jgi:taurine dioxygenase